MSNSVLLNQNTIGYSFIITTRNNKDELTLTVNSICAEAPMQSEIVVVDGSDKPLGADCVKSMMSNDNVDLVYIVDEKKGVFHALNMGIANSCGLWLDFVPAGDTLEKGARTLLESLRDSEDDLIVFSQNVIDQYNQLSYLYCPTEKSVWPHQSVIIKRQVHETFGLFPEKYRYSSDQQFFARIRKNTKYRIRDEVLSVFRLGGITSGVSLLQSREIFEFRRALGCGLFYSTISAYLFPYVRFLLERYAFTNGAVRMLRRIVYPNIKKLA